MRNHEQTGSSAALGIGSMAKVLVILLLGLTLAVIVAAAVSWMQRPVAATGAGTSEAGILYVDWEASGANDGSSWDDAFVDLQLALDVAVPDDEIWVAAGTYYPSVEHGGTGPRYQSYQMLNGVGIYGGFDPTVGDTDWEDRDWIHNQVELSGDLGVPSDPSDNCFHVFYHPGALGLDSTAILDGVTISHGNANDPEEIETIGGGMLNVNASPTLARCRFEANRSSDSGAGLYNDSSAPLITNCTFISNRSGWDGGGIYNNLSSPVVEGTTFANNEALGTGGGVANSESTVSFRACAFLGNEAFYGGGGMVNYGGSLTLTDCIFEGNLATESWGEGGGMKNEGTSVIVTNSTFALNQAVTGGGVHTWGGSVRLTNCTFHGNVADEGGALSNEPNASPVVVNSILWGDTPDEITGGFPVVQYSDVQGGYSGEGNVDEDPLFADAGNGDYHLTTNSPCIDAGTNYAPYLPAYDFEGDERIMDGDDDGDFLVDMGVDEALGATLEPITGLEASNDSPTDLGSTTTLSATIAAGNGVSYAWDLGDYTQQSGKEVTHTYGSTGVYTAVVTASNFISQQSAETVVTIVDVPIAGLEATNDSPTPLGWVTTLEATVTAGTSVSYTWALGDGAFAEGQVVTYVYPEEEVYTAVVTASNPLGSDSASTVVTITPPLRPVYLPLVLRNH